MKIERLEVEISHARKKAHTVAVLQDRYIDVDDELERTRIKLKRAAKTVVLYERAVQDVRIEARDLKEKEDVEQAEAQLQELGKQGVARESHHPWISRFLLP